MKYSELIVYFKKYRLGRMTKDEMICAIGLWQRSGANIHG